MTWNPVRFIETLVHFQVAGPLRSLLETVPLFSRVMASSSLDTVLTPTPLTETILTHGLATPSRDQLATVASTMGYRVESLPDDWAQGSSDPQTLAEGLSLVNVPILVWAPAEDTDVSYPSLSRLIAGLKQANPITEATLTDLSQATPALKDLWGALDDVVMGGVSASQAQWDQGLVFTGNVSTANSGGFASIRTRNVKPPMNLAQWQGTVLKVSGDGQRYKWILRDNAGWDSVAYCRSFDTDATHPVTIRTPFKDMVATFRARTKPDATPLNPTHICSMQLMLSKFEYDGELNPFFQAGGFRLEVSQIGVYREAHRPLILLVGGDDSPVVEVRSRLAEAGLIGIVPQPEGFSVIGAGDTLPGWISPETVSRLSMAQKPGF